MDLMKDRLNQFIKDLGISKNQFAREIGISSAMISKITTKDVNFRYDIVKKIISRYPLLNQEWLLTNIGEMYVENNTQNKHLDIHLVKEANSTHFFTHINERKMGYFWKKVAVFDSEFNKNFDLYSEFEDIIDLFRDYFRETSDIIDQHYQQIQNIDIKELKHKDTTEKIISEFIKSLSSIKENGKHFEELIKLLKESPLIKYWED